MTDVEIVCKFSNYLLQMVNHRELVAGKTYFMRTHDYKIYYGVCTYSTKTKISFDPLYNVQFEQTPMYDEKGEYYAEEYILLNPVEMKQKEYDLKNKADYRFIINLVFCHIPE